MTKSIQFGVTSQFMAREGLTETIQPWEDGIRAPTGPGNFEWWYFDAHFDDPANHEHLRGATAVIVFATKPLLERSGPLKPTLLITITLPDGRKINHFPVFPASQFSASKQGCDVKLGSNWTHGDLHRYELHAAHQGITTDLVFTGLVPAWRPGAGKAYFGDLDHSFGWLPSIPYGSVEGTITIDGQTYNVRGSGYHDHNWGNVGLNDVMDHWYWGRAHLGEYTLIFVQQIGAASYGGTAMPVFMLARGSEILLGDGQPLTLRTADFIAHPGGRAYPREVDFTWQDGSQTISLVLRQPKLIEAISLLASFPAWQRTLFRLFANPYYFRFNADLHLSIHLDHLQAEEHGQALYEIMIMQGKKHP